MVMLFTHHSPMNKDKIGLMKPKNIRIKRSTIALFKLNIDTLIEMPTTMIQPVPVRMMLVQTLMEETFTELSLLIPIMILLLALRREISLLLLRRDTGGIRNSRKNCQDQEVKDRLMLVLAMLVPFQKPNLVSTIARESVPSATKSSQMFHMKPLQISKKALIQKSSKNLKRSKEKLLRRKRRPKKKVQSQKLELLETKKNQKLQLSQSNQQSQQRRKKRQLPSLSTDTIIKSTTSITENESNRANFCLRAHSF